MIQRGRHLGIIDGNVKLRAESLCNRSAAASASPSHGSSMEGSGGLPPALPQALGLL